jgi:hypothetical protein
MKFIYNLVSNFATWLIPILLIVFSFTLNLTNSDLHKQTLKNSDFYSKISNELQGDQLESDQIKSGFGSILFSAVLKDLATPGWIQNLTEKNIDNITGWLKGDQSDLALYVPSKEIEVSATKNIDSQTKEATEKFGDQIEVCNTDQENALKREGLNLDQSFCLPESVKSGQQTLTEFLELKAQDTQNSEFLDQLVRNNTLNPFNDTIKATDLSDQNPFRKNFYENLNRIRSGYIQLYSLSWTLPVASLALFVISMLAAKLAERNLWREARRFLWQSATGTLVAIALLILMLGGSAYLTSFLQNALFQGFGSDQLVSLIALEVVKFTFNLSSISFWIAIASLVVFGVMHFVNEKDLLATNKEKNQKLKLKPETPNPTPNSTFDGNFKNVLLESQNQNSTPNNLNTSQNDLNRTAQPYTAPSFNPAESPDFSTQSPKSVLNNPAATDQYQSPNHKPISLDELKNEASGNPQPKPKIPGF